MKKRACFIVCVAVCFALFNSTVIFADPVLEDKSAGDYIENEQDGAVFDGETSSLTSLQSSNAASYQTDATSLDLSAAEVTVSHMARNVTGSQLFPDVAIRVDGNNLVEGEDYYLHYGEGIEAPSVAGVYTVVAKAIEGSGYTGEVLVGEFSLFDARVDSSKVYSVSSTSNSALVLDAAKNPPYSGSNVSAYLLHGGKNQAWMFELGADGYYVIRSAANPSLVLDAAGMNPASGANVSVYMGNGGWNQKWTLIPADDGCFRIASASNSDLVLDAKGPEPVSGSNIAIYFSHGGDNQSWMVKEATDLSAAKVAMTSMKKNYTGSILTPEISVSVLGETLVEGEDFEVLYNGKKEKPVDVGSYVVSLSAKGGYYSGSKPLGEFIVYPALNQSGACRVYCSANESLVLDAAKASPVSGANVSAYTAFGGANQQWKIVSNQTVYDQLDQFASDNSSVVEDGEYVLYSQVAGHPVVDVRDSSGTEGANVQTGKSKAKESQTWVISHSEEGYVLLQNKASGRYLSVEGQRGASGANVIQSSDAEGRASKWFFIKNNDGSLSLRSGLYLDLALDVAKGSSEPGTNISLWTAHEGVAQKFSLIKVPAEVAPCENIIDEESVFFVKTTVDPSCQMDVCGSSKENGANIQLWSSSTNMWQMFRFEYLDGYYRIVSVYSDKVLDVDGSSLVPESNVILYESWDGADNQLWSAVEHDDGSVSFINKKNGLALSCVTSGSLRGANIETDLVEDSGFADNQKFTLEKVMNLMPVGLYSFHSVVNQNMALDVTGASKTENANIEVWTSNASFAQKWWVQQVGELDNVYTLQATCSGKYLADNGQGNAVQISDPASASTQWAVSIKNGAYIFRNVETGKVLDVVRSGSSAGTNVGTWDLTGGANQQWIQRQVAPITNGAYIIRSLADSGQVVDVPKSSNQNGSQLNMWKFSNGGNQKFNFTRMSDGSYVITNCANGKALDAEQAATATGTRILQYSKSGNANQRWFVEYAGDGGFKLVSAMDPTKVIGFGSAPSNGSGLVLSNDTGVSVQHFTFEATTYVPPLPADRQAMLNRIKWYSSGTQWLIAVDRSTHKVGVFRGSSGNWSLNYYWSCVTGAPGTETITGEFRTTGFKRSSLSTDSRAKYCTQIWGGYFFHTILASESELGHSLSHGCLRMSYPSARWIYDNIRVGTTVVIYN